MLLIIIEDVNGVVEVNREIKIGEVVPVNPIPERGEMRLVASNESATRISHIHFAGVPTCKHGSTSWRGEMAEFIYLNLRGKTL